MPTFYPSASKLRDFLTALKHLQALITLKARSLSIYESIQPRIKGEIAIFQLHRWTIPVPALMLSTAALASSALMPARALKGYCGLCFSGQNIAFTSWENNQHNERNFLTYTSRPIETIESTLQLEMELEGYLVLTDLKRNKVVWRTDKPDERFFNDPGAAMQTDGNLVVYIHKRKAEPMWASEMSGESTPTYCVAVSDNETRYGMSVYDALCRQLWKTPTSLTLNQVAVAAWHDHNDTLSS
ncbi:unnamed protein product [Aphanomyces euteiches]|nr:hypothetical protein AeRB84_009391 [Aphanomyces euteiches]